MAISQSFRSALHGFNREDVVHYIEYLNSKHATEVSRLKNEIDELNAQLKLMQGPAFPDQSEELEQANADLSLLRETNSRLEQQLSDAGDQVSRLRRERDELASHQDQAGSVAAAQANAKSEALTQQLRQLQNDHVILSQDAANARAEAAALAVQLEQLKQENDRLKQNQSSDTRDQELEAYRRAERVERVAAQRASQIYQQANAALADASVQVDLAAQEIGTMADRVTEQLSSLQSAVTGSKEALVNANNILASIRPEE